jgi:estrogen-related receptor beta like 1
LSDPAKHTQFNGCIAVTEVCEALRRARLQIDYPPAKIKQGHGEAVCLILDLLCDGALENKGFRIKVPVYPADTYPEEAPVDEDEEVSADAVADTVGATLDDDDDDVYQPQKAGDKGGGKDAADNKIMESKTDPTAWMVEVENVAPMLKMRVDADNKEWRTHLETTKELHDNINSKTGGTKEALSKLSASINSGQLSPQSKAVSP